MASYESVAPLFRVIVGIWLPVVGTSSSAHRWLGEGMTSLARRTRGRGSDLLDRVSLALAVPDAFGYEDRLSEAMCVPVGACARCEVDAAGAGDFLRGRQRLVECARGIGVRGLTLAARFVPVGEELRMPTWSSAWHLKEAQLHSVDGVISLGEDDFFSVRRLEAAGIPVLTIRADNVDRRTWSEERLIEQIGEFIETRVQPASDARRPG